MSEPKLKLVELAGFGYAAFARKMADRGQPQPSWDQLTKTKRMAWGEAARAIWHIVEDETTQPEGLAR